MENEDLIQQAKALRLKDQFPKRCRVCGTVWLTLEEWRAQPLRYTEQDAYSTREGRDCKPPCNNTTVADVEIHDLSKA